MSEPIVTVGPDQRCYVLLEEHERVRRKKALMAECLMGIARVMNGTAAPQYQWQEIARLMNWMADGLEAENATLDTETRPAPLGD